MLNAEDDRRDGCQDVGGAEGSGHDQPRADCDGGDSDWLADLEAKQREYDDHCCFELDKRLEREIREPENGRTNLTAGDHDQGGAL